MNPSDLPHSACALERFPHIYKRVCPLWSSPELHQFLNHLITDTRGGHRKGFPADALLELMFLIELNKLCRAIDLARTQKKPLREALDLVNRQDSGIGYGDEAANGRDAYAREAPDLSRKKKEVPPPPPPPPQSGLIDLLFGLLTNKLVLLLVALYAAYQFGYR